MFRFKNSSLVLTTLIVLIIGIVFIMGKTAVARPNDPEDIYLPILTKPDNPPPQIADCNIFPKDNIWNTPIDTAPLHSNSTNYINTIGSSRGLHADFGSGVWPPGSDSPIGIPYVVVDSSQPKVAVTFDYADESDPGPYPIPPDAPIEGGPTTNEGDRHVLVLEKDNCLLYELFAATKQANNSWEAGSGAIFDLNSHDLRPDGWTSADAAGLPILPGLVRYDEVAAGEINHAIRFTAPQTQGAYVWPARHFASSQTDRHKLSTNGFALAPQSQL